MGSDAVDDQDVLRASPCSTRSTVRCCSRLHLRWIRLISSAGSADVQASHAQVGKTYVAVGLSPAATLTWFSRPVEAVARGMAAVAC